MDKYNYTIQDLVKTFEKQGMKVSQAWIRRQEAKGNLIIPHSTTNFKKPQGTRPKGAVRIFTQNQLNEIVEAFLPNGRGYYNYNE